MSFCSEKIERVVSGVGGTIRHVAAWGLLAAVLLGIAGVAVWIQRGEHLRQGGWGEKHLEGLKTFGEVPDFSLIERSRRPVALSDLEGRIWVANFIYTNCPETCPVQSAQMKELQEDFIHERDLRLVSITVDPERDTPNVLSEYAERFAADPRRWLFLTGEQEEIYRLAQDGFRLAAAEIPYGKRPSSGATHAHSPRFVLVDRKGQIRGYYISTDGQAMVRLRQDMKSLLGNSKQ